MDDRLMTINEAASYLDIDPMTLRQRRYRERVGIPVVKVGKSVRFSRKMVEKFNERKEEYDNWRNNELMTMKEVASYFHIGITTLRQKRYRERLGIPVVRLGGVVYFERKDVQAFVERSVESFSDAKEQGS